MENYSFSLVKILQMREQIKNYCETLKPSYTHTLFSFLQPNNSYEVLFLNEILKCLDGDNFKSNGDYQQGFLELNEIYYKNAKFLQQNSYSTILFNQLIALSQEIGLYNPSITAK